MAAADISAVRDELDRILSSPVFAKSPRISRFLRYVVEQTLEGNSDRIKEYTLAIEVFDKNEEFDPQADSTVRTEATKLRARLSRYYQTDGSADTIVIAIPKGAYVPVWEDRRQTAGIQLSKETDGQGFASVTPKEREEAGSTHSSVRRKRPFATRALIAAAICLLLTVLAVLKLSSTRDIAARITSSSETRRATPVPRQVWKGGHTDVPGAQTHYARAKHFDSFGTVDSITKAIDEYLLCVAKDPGFASAYADLSMAYSRLMEIDTQRSRDLLKLANVAALKAVELDDSLAAAHHAAARAQVAAWNWKAAEPEFLRALQLDPTSTAISVDYASLYLNMMGRYDESLELLRRRLATDPTSRMLRTAIGGTLLQACRYDDAIGAYTESLGLQETPGTLTFIGIALAAQGRYEEAIQRQQRARVLNPGDPWIVAHLAYTSARSGRTRKARDHVKELREMVRDDHAIAVELAGVYSGLGDREQALRWLKRAMEARSPKLRWLGVDQRFRQLHDEERFRDLLRTVGLPVQWDG